MIQPKQKRPKPGKPRLSETEKTVKVLTPMLESQREKMHKLGGAAWVRDQIDKAVMTKNPES